MSAASDAMQALTQQWYNALIAELSLDPQKFQMVQGNVALGSTSNHLWNMMDSIPPESITQYWTPGGVKTFSSEYGGLLYCLKDPSHGQFQADMKDYYQPWSDYQEKNTPATGQTPLEFFTSWAQSKMPPDLTATVVADYAKTLLGPIGQAIAAYLAAGAQTGIKAFDQSIEEVDNVAASAPPGSVNVDMSTMSSDTSRTWAKGSVSGFVETFFGGADVSYDKQTLAVTASGLSFAIKFDHVATIPIIALSKGTKTTGGTTYQPWFVPTALSLAYSSNNYNTWNPGPPDWTTYFGPTGTLPRIADSLIVVNGISVTITSSKAIAESTRTEVTEAFNAGFFPFFGINGQGGWTSSQSFDDNGRLTVTSTCPVGNPQILGILQLPINQAVSKESMLDAMRANRGANGLGAAHGPFSFTTEVCSPTKAQATLTVSVAWTPDALAQLRNFGASPAVESLIVGNVNAWATNNAPHWAVGSLHNYNGGPPSYWANALVITDSGGVRVVNIITFV